MFRYISHLDVSIAYRCQLTGIEMYNNVGSHVTPVFAIIKTMIILIAPDYSVRICMERNSVRLSYIQYNTTWHNLTYSNTTAWHTTQQIQPDIYLVIGLRRREPQPFLSWLNFFSVERRHPFPLHFVCLLFCCCFDLFLFLFFVVGGDGFFGRGGGAILQIVYEIYAKWRLSEMYVYLVF